MQLGESVDPESLFSKYIWVTSTSEVAKAYSKEFAKNAIAHSKIKKPRVVEVASNDGTFLKAFQSLNCEVLGVDPAKNIAETASNNGIETLNRFFNAAVAEELVAGGGKRDIVFARNVLPHVKEIHSVANGIKILTKDNGLAIIEFHDASQILKNLHYDSIYHEHLFFFSLKTISQILSRYNLKPFDIKPSPISGGSWVVYLSIDQRRKSNNLLKAEDYEKALGINEISNWKKFAARSTEHANKIKKIISDKRNGLIAYGASARSSTLLNFCKINNKQIEFIIDKNPLKHGKKTPGSNIPVVALEKGTIDIEKRRNILLLAWNFKDEIIHELRDRGFKGNFIIPLPNEPYVI